MNKYLRRALALGLSGVLTAGPVMAEGSMREELKAGIAEDAATFIRGGESGMYSGAVWSNRSAKFPASYDLREQGYVPAVRNQGNWGTCWGFACIGASEVSILSKLGMTVEEFLDAYGLEMNLSEKHLAWFASCAIPEGEEQAGEGIVLMDADIGQSAHYNSGGMLGYASSMFSAGVGPVWEKVFPYEASDGTSSVASDWTLPEEVRYNLSFEMENSSLLPSPAGIDQDGNYCYNRMGTEAIKQELLAGRAVAISYHSDQTMSPEAQLNILIDQLKALGYPQEKIDRFMELKAKYQELGDEADASADEEYMSLALEVAIMTLSGISYDEYKAMQESAQNDAGADTETGEEVLDGAEAEAEAEPEPDNKADEAAEAARREAAEQLGLDYDSFMADLDRMMAASSVQYINTDTYAQYTDNKDAIQNHGVCIVGWDDDYAVSNFPADHQPPAAGAWIVRNSWGNGYGNDGYLYLSYYDQSIRSPETFDFIVDEMNRKLSEVDIHSYDLMPSVSVDSVKMNEPTYIANVFTTECEEVLSAVSVMTASMNANVTVAVYLLNEGATSPVDGTMLDTVTASYEFGGYHRISLNQNYLVPAGARIGIVQLQRSETSDGIKYTVPYSAAQNKACTDTYNKVLPEMLQGSSYFNGVIGEKESFIMLDGEWADWADVVTELYAAGGDFRFLTYDNLNMKAYFYRYDELTELHSFGETVPYYGASAVLCEDCGYTVVDPS